MTLQEFYRGKRVLVTGHTGFKGTWLCRMLTGFGAEVTGFALNPPTHPNLHDRAGLSGQMTDIRGNVCDFSALQAAFAMSRPEIVIHLAAQPIVRESYRIPRETFAWIDVFPLDGMPGGRLHRKLHGLELLYRRARVQLSMFEQNVNVHKRGRPWHERAVIALYRATGIGKGSDTFRMMEKLDRALRRCPADESPVWVNFMGAYKLKESFPADAYGAGVPCVFEGRELMIPRQSARILTQLYGDYMIPRMPSEEDSHRIVRRTDAGN